MVVEVYSGFPGQHNEIVVTGPLAIELGKKIGTPLTVHSNGASKLNMIWWADTDHYE